MIAFYIGKRNKNAAKKFWDKIPNALKNSYFETDDWDAHLSIIPKKKHEVGKDLIYYIEGLNATVRTSVNPLARKTCSFSKRDEWRYLTIE